MLTGKGGSFSTLSRDAVRKKNLLVVWEASLKRDESWLAYRRPSWKGHNRPREKVQHCMKLATVKFVNGFRPSDKWLVRQECVCVCVCVRACVRTYVRAGMCVCVSNLTGA